MTEASLRGAQVSNRANFSPNRQSYFGAAGLHGNIARPSAAIQNRPVMARTSPAAAAHMPVRTFSSGNSQGGRGTFNNGNFGGVRAPVMGRTAETGAAANRNRPSFAQGGQPNAAGSSRQRELSNDKPQSHMRNAPADSRFNGGTGGQTNAGNSRNWSAQGSTTDRGRAPSGSGSNSPRGTAMNHSDRPSWASGSGGNGRSGYSVSPRPSNSGNRPDTNSSRGNSRSFDPPQRSSGSSNNRPPSYNSNSNRGFSQPRSYNPPQRTYSPPQRSYSSPSQPRSYAAPSAPSRSYSLPSRGYSAPSHSSGGGGTYHGGGGSQGGGGGSRGGGGGPRGGGGGSNHGGGGSPRAR